MFFSIHTNLSTTLDFSSGFTTFIVCCGVLSEVSIPVTVSAVSVSGAARVMIFRFTEMGLVVWVWNNGGEAVMESFGC